MTFRHLLFVSAVFWIAGLASGSAQETVLGGNAEPSAPPAAVWETRCVSDGRQVVADCSIVQRAVVQKTGQLVGMVTVRTAPGGKPTLLTSTPLGLFIPGGVNVDVDGTSPQKLDLQTCDRNGCLASLAISDGLLGAMQKGQKFNVSFQGMNKQMVTLPMSLAGFTAAYQKIN
ncbi:MAG TPA: invasion associated locus B family protein [Arsenicitalea sp.]|nr:invasion associated locus B family protein [Arsenicitalea sp.]